MKLTPEAERAIGAIVAVGGRPLLVGGFVRDHFLGVESKDIDIEVHGPVTVESVAAALRKLGKVDEVGKSFGVLKMGGLDISFPRRDRRIGDGHTGFAIEVDHDMTVTEALERRDFTINSVAYDPITKQVIDPFLGRWDLGRRTLRHTSKHFADDPLRVLRAVQFASRFGFTLHPDTAELCRSLKDRYTELSVERVWMEWSKILTNGQMLPAFIALEATGWLEFFPGLTREAAEHADRKVAEAHLLTVIEDGPEWTPERRAVMIVSMLFGYQREIATLFLRAIDAPGWLGQGYRAMFMEAHWEPEFKSPEQVVRRAARKLGSRVLLRDFLVAHNLVKRLWGTAFALGVLDAPQPRLLTGDSLQAAGWTPGPIFAEILLAAEHAQDLEGWISETEALAWLAEHYPEAS